MSNDLNSDVQRDGTRQTAKEVYESVLQTRLIPLLERALTGRSVKGYEVGKDGSVVVYLTGTPTITLVVASINEGPDQGE